MQKYASPEHHSYIVAILLTRGTSPLIVVTSLFCGACGLIHMHTIPWVRSACGHWAQWYSRGRALTSLRVYWHPACVYVCTYIVTVCTVYVLLLFVVDVVDWLMTAMAWVLPGGASLKHC